MVLQNCVIFRANVGQYSIHGAKGLILIVKIPIFRDHRGSSHLRGSGGSLLRTLAAPVSHPEPHRAFLGIATGYGDGRAREGQGTQGTHCGYVKRSAYDL
jgi:hypothetical protein